MEDADWIVNKIHRADPASEPVHDLGWLIANLPIGVDAWRKSKGALFEKVSAPRRWLLADALACFGTMSISLGFAKTCPRRVTS